jgi:hypothetical protein
MSHPTEPYAKGYGILLGVALLWVATLAVMIAVRALLFSPAAPSEEGEGEETGANLPRTSLSAERQLASRSAVPGTWELHPSNSELPVHAAAQAGLPRTSSRGA